MKIQLDTTAKTIKIEDKVNLGEFMEAIKTLLPDGVWKEFSLEANTVIYKWSNPIIVRPFDPYVPTTQPLPWWQDRPYYTTNASTSATYNSSLLNDGVYNIELNGK